MARREPTPQREDKSFPRTFQARQARYTVRQTRELVRMRQLPCRVEAKHAQARYQNGVLRVTIPRNARAKSRRVKVQVCG